MRTIFSPTRALSLRTRSATALAAVGALVLSSGLVVMAAPGATANGGEGGNNGTVKINGYDLVDVPDGNDNEPFVGCAFEIQWYNFSLADANEDSDGKLDVSWDFELTSPTGSANGNTFVVNPDGSADLTFDAAKAPNAVKPFQLQISGPTAKAPNDKHGYHVKVTVRSEASQGNNVKHKVFWTGSCQPAQPDPVVVPLEDERMTCAAGVEAREGTQTTTYVWNAETRQYDPVVGPEVWGPWMFVRNLTDAEFQRLGCQPAQPDPVVVPLEDERMTCAAGVEAREGTQTTTYVWNAETRQYAPVVGPEVWGEWTFVRDLTEAEFEELGCRPDQPDPVVAPLSDERMSCDNGVEQREGTQTTTYVWNAETRTYDQVVGEELWGEWVTVRDLTAAEAIELDCVAGEETVVPKPTKQPAQTPKPTVLGTEAAVPTQVDAGIAGLPAAGSSTSSLLAQLMVGGGLLLLAAGGWMGLGRRAHGVHQA